MKNLFFFLFAVFFSIGISQKLYSQNNSGNIQLSGGMGFGTEIQSIGFQAGGLYTINSQFRAVADLIYYLPGEDANGLEFNWLEVNANGHYLIIKKENLNAYLLTGLNFSKLFSDDPNIKLPSVESTDQLYVGVNIGGGIEFPLGALDGYLMGKYALSSAHQLALTGGIRIPIN